MPQSSIRNRRDISATSTPSNKRDLIIKCLKIQVQTFPQKELFPEEIEHWQTDLGRYPNAAIENAFDSWRRNGHWFPVYADIIQLCDAWEPPASHYAPNCSAECKSRHGKGYHLNDIWWLYEHYQQVRHTLPMRPMTDTEIDKLLDDLDKKRGGAPAWRQT